ncbi:deoxyribonuclease V [Azospirillum canadense]|uniref:deoxyribonuclease V n=1 Tax=Azospirillum canadense TaxID=403962 RepID=UPI002226858D|nr:deoxyribonuclease V [Azospirillum canadense]MCW2236913.1 deoxyribonuclease V [Azospirillum canadense]
MPPVVAGMDGVFSEPWPTTEAVAHAVQERLRRLVVTRDDFGPLRRIAAVDAHFSEDRGLTWAAVAELDADSLELTSSALLCQPTRFPYIPGLLSFREAPAMVEAIGLLPEPPDLLVIDGQGTAHPRRFGLACHVGVLTGLPAIGVAKSRLVGRYEDLGETRGSCALLWHRREVIGAALRTRDGTNPLFVSPGHRVSLETCIQLVLRFAPRWRLPEPIRLADALSRMHG